MPSARAAPMVATLASYRMKEGMAVVLRFPLGDEIEMGLLEPWHAEEYLAAVDRAREHLRPWVPHATYMTDLQATRELLQRFADSHAADSGHLFGIWLDGDIAGVVMFLSFSTATGVCEIGVWLAPEIQGRGLATRAVRYFIGWAIEARGIYRVEWRNDPRNEPSRAAARRLGMTWEGVLRSASVFNGVRVDSEVWSVTAEDWPTEPAKG
jgi:ribosomal-protein-serine acetyltransferase